MLKRPPEKAKEKPNKKIKIANNSLITQFLRLPTKSENDVPKDITKPLSQKTQLIQLSQIKNSNSKGVENLIKPVKKSDHQESKLENWTKMLTPDEKVAVLKIEEEPDDEFYLNFFRSIFDVLKLYGETLVNQEEMMILDKFESLNESAKILFVRLFMRKRV